MGTGLQDFITAWGTAIGAAAAVGASVVALLAAVDARRSAAAERDETKRQGAIAYEAMLMDYHSSILDWSDESIDWVSKAHGLTFLDPKRMPGGEFFDRRAECLWRISSLIDRGRMFFPNDEPDSHGEHKHGAFRGLRLAVIDQLKGIHDLIGELNSPREGAKSQDEIRKLIETKKRLFVSEVQREVDPRSRRERLKKILFAESASVAVERSFEQ